MLDRVQNLASEAIQEGRCYNKIDAASAVLTIRKERRSRMLFKTFEALRTGLVEQELLSLRRNKLRTVMLRATGKRRHSQTKEEMIAIIMGNTNVQTVRRILAYTTR